MYISLYVINRLKDITKDQQKITEITRRLKSYQFYFPLVLTKHEPWPPGVYSSHVTKPKH